MINVVNNKNFKINENVIKKAVLETLKKNNFNEDVDVEVAVVSKNEMDKLNDKYYHDEKYEHPVFTFPENINDKSGKFKLPPGENRSLGQIVLNYDFAENDEKVYDLIAHSTLHLLGIHH